VLEVANGVDIYIPLRYDYSIGPSPGRPLPVTARKILLPITLSPLTSIEQLVFYALSIAQVRSIQTVH